jgi:hypothetical protein
MGMTKCTKSPLQALVTTAAIFLLSALTQGSLRGATPDEDFQIAAQAIIISLPAETAAPLVQRFVEASGQSPEAAEVLRELLEAGKAEIVATPSVMARNGFRVLSDGEDRLEVEPVVEEGSRVINANVILEFQGHRLAENFSLRSGERLFIGSMPSELREAHTLLVIFTAAMQNLDELEGEPKTPEDKEALHE